MTPGKSDPKSRGQQKGKKNKKRNFDPWDTFNQLTRTGINLPLLFMPQIPDINDEISRIVSGRSTIKPAEDDIRFQGKEWTTNPIYKASMQAYLSWCQSLESIVGSSSLSESGKHAAQDAARVLEQHLSPSYSTTSFKVMSRAQKTRGASLVHGLKRLTDDIVFGNTRAASRRSKFKLGKTLATSEGSVVYSSPELELIQYRPLTSKVWKTPLLLIPSPIYRYYIHDLQPSNSLVRYLLQAGHQVFVLSWRNPGQRQKNWDIETYVAAAKKAVQPVLDITTSKSLNLVGSLAGAIFATMLASVLTQRPDSKRVNSLTLIAATLDTHNDSQIGSLLNSQIVMASKTLARAKGTMDGREVAQIFSWLRPNNFMWNAWACNYFAGEDAPSADILHWINDSARIPAELHCNFLDMYKSSPLQSPTPVKICDRQVALDQVTCDYYQVAGSSDHVCPWESCYQSSLALGGKRNFILVNRGHANSLICPESEPEVRFYTNTEVLQNPEDWLSEATQHEGSWWPNWLNWLQERSGISKNAPKQTGNKNYPAGDPAPGKFLFK